MAISASICGGLVKPRELRALSPRPRTRRAFSTRVFAPWGPGRAPGESRPGAGTTRDVRSGRQLGFCSCPSVLKLLSSYDRLEMWWRPLGFNLVSTCNFIVVGSVRLMSMDVIEACMSAYAPGVPPSTQASVCQTSCGGYGHAVRYLEVSTCSVCYTYSIAIVSITMKITVRFLQPPRWGQARGDVALGLAELIFRIRVYIHVSANMFAWFSGGWLYRDIHMGFCLVSGE